MHNVKTSPAVSTKAQPEADYGDLNDAELVEFMAFGEQEACAVLFQRHSREMAAWLMSHTRNLLNNPAEHFVNEAFLNAFRSASSFHLPPSTPAEKVTLAVKGWLYSILRNV
jgi:DNA-directed RNA polymerase specialized sigma24 family protein